MNMVQYISVAGMRANALFDRLVNQLANQRLAATAYERKPPHFIFASHAKTFIKFADSAVQQRMPISR